MAARKNRAPRRILLVSAVALAAVAVSLATVGIGPRTTNVAGNGVISIASTDVRPGTVRFFSYRDDAGSRIRFLLTRDEAGHARGAIDACQRCYTFHKGYTASRDGYLICRLCGNKYKIDDKNLGIASCTPVKLPVAESGAAVEVKTQDLEHARSMF